MRRRRRIQERGRSGGGTERALKVGIWGTGEAAKESAREDKSGEWQMRLKEGRFDEGHLILGIKETKAPKRTRVRLRWGLKGGVYEQR